MNSPRCVLCCEAPALWRMRVGVCLCDRCWDEVVPGFGPPEEADVCPPDEPDPAEAQEEVR